MLKRLSLFLFVLAIFFAFSLSTPINLIYSQTTNNWNAMTVPQAGSSANTIEDIVAISKNDMWAVGNFNNNGRTQTLTQHWNGTTWSTIPSPNISETSNRLKAVAARASNDVWAVGTHSNYVNNIITYGIVLMHWDGKLWTITPRPYDNLSNSIELNDIFIASQNDVWVVGKNNIKALLLHWNGQVWTEHTLPGIKVLDEVTGNSISSSLDSIYGTSANDIWAVGIYNQKTLAIHWDGNSWSIVPSPNEMSSSYSNLLSGVIGFTANNYWAVGSYSITENDTAVSYPIVLRWDGTTWKTTQPPLISAWNSLVPKISGTGSNDLWMYMDKGSSYSTMRAFAMHYDGQLWQEVPLPAFANEYTTIRSIITPDKQTTYAAGWYVEGMNIKSAILQYLQVTPSVTQVPSPTKTPTPTSTPTPTPRPNAQVTFSTPKISNITKNSATITWSTNTPSSTKVKFSTSFLFFTKSTPTDNARTTSHTVTLNNLSSKKTHYIKLYGANAAGKEYSSKTHTFKTL